MTTENQTDLAAAAEAAAQAAAAAEQTKQPDQQPAPEAGEAKPEEKPPEPTKPEAEPFEPTGDPALDVALDYAASQGLTPASPEIEAARGGDFTKLEAYLKERAAPGWEKQLALAKGAYERVIDAAKTRAVKEAEAIYAVAGGKDQWEAARSFVATVATPAQKEEINAGLTKGGLIAEAMAAYVVQTFKAKGSKGAKQPGEGKAEGAPGSDALDSRSYARAVENLSRANRGRDVTSMPEYRALVARRQAGRAAGLK
jgi:hypothetical protein